MAFLENTLHPEIESQKICDVSWEHNPHEIRKNLEEAVYSSPRLLDDFSTRIVLFDPNTLFFPTEIVETTPDMDLEKVYCDIFGGEPTDVMTGGDKDITAAWAMNPGIRNFLYRTFPGARITCNLLEKVRNYRNEGSELRLVIDCRNVEADLILFQGPDLISASTHNWRHPDDVAYLSLNLLDVYGRKLEDLQINVQGLETESDAWEIIKKRCLAFQ